MFIEMTDPNYNKGSFVEEGWYVEVRQIFGEVEDKLAYPPKYTSFYPSQSQWGTECLFRAASWSKEPYEKGRLDTSSNSFFATKEEAVAAFNAWWNRYEEQCKHYRVPVLNKKDFLVGIYRIRHENTYRTLETCDI